MAADQQIALAVNPYHLGFSLWEKIIEKQGLDAARRIMQEDDDFGFHPQSPDARNRRGA
ncbi:MAG: hypothetical protein WDM77_12635 [Steroidobacteraceae bacterium]